MRRDSGRDRQTRDIDFALQRAARKFFDGAAIKRPGREIHFPKAAALRQFGVDETKALEQLLPIDLGDHPKAGDDVSHGDVDRALSAMHLAHRRVRGEALFGQPLVEPGQRRRELRVLVAQPMHQLDGKGVRQWPVGTASEDGRGRLGRTAADAEQSIRKAIGLATRGAAHSDQLGEASQVLDQHDLQSDRGCPEFADGEGLNLLIGVDVGDEHLNVEATVGMRDIRPSHSEHARIAGERARDKFRELTIVTGRQVRADLTQLLLHEMVIVDQPLRRRRNRASVVGRRDDGSI